MSQIFSENPSIIEDILNRIMNCMRINKLYIYNNSYDLLEGLYYKIEKIYIDNFQDFIYEGFIYIKVCNKESLLNILPWIEKNKNQVDILLYVTDKSSIDFYEKALGKSYGLENFSPLQGQVYLLGRKLQFPKNLKVPTDFKVLAIIHSYNEADIINKTLSYLLKQGLDIYLVDNWSNDGTFEIAQNFQEKFPQRVFLERFPEEGQTQYYEWFLQLKKTEDISKTLPYDWFIHYDVDEIRISPWKNVSLLESVFWIDLLGYNLIENTVIDFKLTNEYDENIFMNDVYFDFGHKDTHFMQTKSWKKTEEVNLKDSGGHIANVPNPKVYPLKILNRHYPFRSIEQAQKKVFADRKPRFEKEHRSRGWHGHYDFIQNKQDFMAKSQEIIKWNDKTFYDYYIPLFFGCGIEVIGNGKAYESQFPPLLNKKIVIYGAGNIGKTAYKAYSKCCDIVGWVDQNYNFIPNMYCITVESPERVISMDFDYVVIAVGDESIREEIRDNLNHMKIGADKILW